ncbi:hypothetical protein [Thioflexithrix psekupsensis]|uniref:Big-1 domain-containing protein n=2 Tax=Thioflexithrix psekupsensis TaxID=1570016 RepID=A0A251XBZ9_9GAMM|nr:hypothetical protein [Thioflexithrix psekupsensis]OUD16047.1 hypothetical protein TPSD3_01185 [Thioflexithrix psekupsensis]
MRHFQLQIKFYIQFSLLLAMVSYSGFSFATLTRVDSTSGTVLKGAMSEFLMIRVNDAQGGIRAGVKLGFSLTNTACEAVNVAVLDVLDGGVSDAQGIVHVRLNAASPLVTAGIHTVDAWIADEPAVRLTIPLIVEQHNSLFVTQGQCQTVNVGQTAQPIIFRFLDNGGLPRTLIDVRFELHDSNGTVGDGLLIVSGTTNEQGQVQTLVSTTRAGKWTVSAHARTALDFTASLGITVLPMEASVLAPVAGEQQSLNAGRLSEPFIFVLQDVFGNVPITQEGQTVHFSVVTPSGITTTTGLTRTTAISNAQGQVSTQFTAPDVLGTYRIQANLPNRPANSGMTLVVQSALPGLPSLGFGTVTDEALSVLAHGTRTVFAGGVSVNGGSFLQESVISSTAASVHFQALLSVDPQDVGQMADVFVLLAHTPPPLATQASTIYMVTPQGLPIWQPEMGLAAIQAFQANTVLRAHEVLDIYRGTFPHLGWTRLLFGYRLKDKAQYVFHLEHWVSVLVQ